jgi:hypothetical protein
MNNEILVGNLSQLQDKPDGLLENNDVSIKEMSTFAFSPSSIACNSDGKLLAVNNDSEYLIYWVLSGRVMAYWKGRELAWGIGETYAVWISSEKIQIYKNFEPATEFTPPHKCERMFSGLLLGVTGNEIGRAHV